MAHHRIRALLGGMLAGAAALAAAPIAPAALAAQTVAPDVVAGAALPREGARTQHVVVISIDGLRPDAIAKFSARTLQRLMQEGSYTLDAKTILPSTTLPSHTSMLTGVEPDAHGITWNRNQTAVEGKVRVPTIFSEARGQGLTTAAFFSKGKFEHLDTPHSLDHLMMPSGNDRWGADRTVANVEHYLATERPNLMFVHFAEPDYAGHRFSWMSWFYGRAVRRADEAVNEVLTAATRAFGEGNFTMIVTADHGGHGWGHGSADPRDVTIPWIAWGRGVNAGTRVESEVRTMDTADTALWLLGLPALGSGSPVRAAFGGGASPAVAGALPAPEAGVAGGAMR